jgi:hypothetical protein
MNYNDISFVVTGTGLQQKIRQKVSAVGHIITFTTNNNESDKVLHFQ